MVVEVVEHTLALMQANLADLVEVNVIPVKVLVEEQEMVEDQMIQCHQAMDGEMMVEKL
tara:strand:+ start:109 stop:285 length:177 start_codon:yes stop_codon:yes gene_type:complete